MATDKPKKPAGLVFKEFQEARLAEQAAREHKWTLSEVEAFDNRWSKADPKTQVELNALRPLITTSNERGEFRYPWQMSREDAKAHFAERGVTGVLWSTAEMRAIANDPTLSKDYLDEVSQAQREGRLIVGPPRKDGQPQVFHFADESFVAGSKEHEAFKRNLNAKLKAIDKRKELERDVEKAFVDVDKMREAELQPADVLYKVRAAVEAVKKNPDDYNSDLYPYQEQPAWQKLTALIPKLEQEQADHTAKLNADSQRNQRERARSEAAAARPRPEVVVTEPLPSPQARR